MMFSLPRLALLLAVVLPLAAAAQNAPWAQVLRSPGPETSINQIVSDASNAAYISGSAYDTASLGPLRFMVARRLYPNGFVARLDAQGTPQWVRPLADPISGTRAFITGLATDAQGNVLLCGSYERGPLPLDSFTLPARTETQGVVAKLSAAGTVLWAQPLTAPAGQNMYCTALTTDAAGNVHVAVSFGTAAPAAQSGLGMRRFTASGTPGAGLDWPGVLDLPGSPFGAFASITKLTVNASTGQLGAIGEFFGTLTLRAASGGSPALAFTSPPEPGRGAFVAGLAGTGAVQWAQELASQGLTNGNSGSYYNKLLGLAPMGSGFAVGGGYLGAGRLATRALPVSGADTTRVVLAHFDQQGQLQWHRLLESDGQPNSRLVLSALTTDANNELHVGGFFRGELAPASGGLRSSGSVDLWLSRYSAQGQRLGSQRDGGSGTVQLLDLALTTTGQPLVVGKYSLGGPLGGITLPLAIAPMGFVARLGSTPLAAPTAGAPQPALQVYPNPSAGAQTLRVALPAAGGPVVLRLLDVLGREVRRQPVTGAAGELPVAGLPAGTYLLQANSAAGSRCQRVVLQ